MAKIQVITKPGLWFDLLSLAIVLLAGVPLVIATLFGINVKIDLTE